MKLKFLILFAIFAVVQIDAYGQIKPKEPPKSMGNKGVVGEGPGEDRSGNGSGGMTKEDTISIFGIKIFKNTAEGLRHITNKSFEPIIFYEWKDSIIDTTNYGYWFPHSHGITLKNVSYNKARNVHNQFYHSMLKYQGLYLFLTNLHTDSIQKVFFDLAIVEAKSQFEAVKKVGTNSKNQDISNEQIVKNLKLWNEENHFKITAIYKNQIEITLWSNQGNIEKFVNQIYEVWPEVVDSSYGSKQQMIDYLKINTRFLLKFD